ncbi:MAG: serine hydrolase domain-containing protein [Longimicrobiales bacterium]
MRSVPLFSPALAMAGAFLLTLPCAPQVPHPEQGQVERELRIDSVFSHLDNTRSPGCAVGVVEGGQLALAKGYGMANLDHGISITPQTVFRTGSVSKQFTAAVIVLLAGEGALSLDDGVRTHFPELPELYGGVTVRHLLHHTSGVRDYLELMAMRGVGDEATYTEDDVVRLLALQRALNFPVGSQFLYSNSGYLLLSRLVHRVTGKTLREEAERLLFEPLEMTRSHFHDDHRGIVPDRATGYGSGREGRFFVDQTTLDIVGDGGVFTNIEELTRWMANFWSLEVGGPDWRSAMETRGVLVSGDTLDYALGLRWDRQGGLPAVGHGGAFVGYRAATLRYPSEDVAVMVLCNYARTNPSEMAERIGRIWLEDRMEPAVAPEVDRESRPEGEVGPEPVTLPPDLQQALRGEFYSPELDTTYRILQEAEGLVLDLDGILTLPLEARGGDTLVAGGWLSLTYEVEGGVVARILASSGRVEGVAFARR